MEQTSVLEAQEGTVTAINSAVQVNKLLQIISGAVYGEEQKEIKVDPSRAELVMDLVEERDHSVVGFTWQHEKKALLEQARKRKLKVGVIDGRESVRNRTKTVGDFQDGALRAVLCHPAAAAHGLTLTRGRATIWSSATYSSEFFQQLNRRIYRAGQDKKTETIMICANDSREAHVYDVLDGKIEGIDAFQALIGGR